METRSFLDVMRALMKRPGMYIGECRSQESLRNAIMLIEGMSCLDNTDTMKSFQNWLMSEKSSKSTPFGWPDMVGDYLKKRDVKPENEVSAFIDLFAEFLESQGIHNADPLKQKIKLKVSEGDPDVAYLTLPGHPGRGTEGCVSSTQKIRDVIPDYKGPDLNLDFDNEGTLIGIEILA